MRWPLMKPMQASAARTDPVVSMGCWQLAIGLSVVGGRASKVSSNPDVLCTLPPVGASPLPMPAHRLPTPRFPTTSGAGAPAVPYGPPTGGPSTS